MSHVCDGRDPRCAACQALARRLPAVRRAMTVDDAIDDVTRARIWTQLEDRLAERAQPKRSRAGVIAGAAAAAVVAVAAIAALRPDRPEARTLTVPVDTVVAARIGPHTSASIAGPAELELGASTGDTVAVRLRRGTLLAAFDGGPGRSLRVETPSAVVEVVGTRFAVEVDGGTTCTSVLHGRVRVVSDARTVLVAAGERYCSGASGAPIEPIREQLRTALARLEPPPPEAQDPVPSAVRAETAVAEAASPAAEQSPTSASANRTTAPVLRLDAPGPASAAPPSVSPSAQTRAETSVATTATPPRLSSAAPRPDAGASMDDMPAAATGLRRSGVTRAEAPTPSAMSPVVASTALRQPETSVAMNSTLPTPPSAAPRPSGRVPAGPAAAQGADLRSAAPRPAPVESPTTPVTSDATGSTVPPPSAPARAPRATADELYRAAEAELAAHDPATADRALAALVTEYPDSPLVDQALYDRARIAYERRAWPAARDQLDRLVAIPGTPLAEPGQYLRCRIAAETREAMAAACVAGFRAAFPRSPHDLDALALLVELAHARAGCAGAAALVEELAQRYSRSALAASWRARCPEPR